MEGWRNTRVFRGKPKLIEAVFVLALFMEEKKDKPWRESSVILSRGESSCRRSSTILEGLWAAGKLKRRKFSDSHLLLWLLLAKEAPPLPPLPPPSPPGLWCTALWLMASGWWPPSVSSPLWLRRGVACRTGFITTGPLRAFGWRWRRSGEELLYVRL